MSIKIHRQNVSANEPLPPPSLAHGNIASNKNGKLYAGDSSNSPISMLDERTYNQVGNPNLLDNSDFTNAVK